MNLFYNTKGVGNVLMGQLTTEKPEKTKVVSKGDVTLIYNAETEKVVAFNLFNASNYVELSAEEVEVNEQVVEQIQQAFSKNEVSVELDVDFSPKFVIGHVLTKEKHPNADKLSICKVDVGTETLQIVCGASNVDANQKVVVAKVGAVMPSGLVIRDAELRGIASSGMICSGTELNLPNAEEGVGILVLAADSVIGEPFQF